MNKKKKKNKSDYYFSPKDKRMVGLRDEKFKRLMKIKRETGTTVRYLVDQALEKFLQKEEENHEK